MADKPNILIITTDQQSFRMMSCAGNPWLSTPNIDRIAAAGVRFDRAYCSNPVCVPSRFSWWTGRMPSAIGLRESGGIKSPLPQEIHRGALGHIARSAGYRTAFAGKFHLPGDLTPSTMGFDYLCKDERDRLAVKSGRFIRKANRRSAGRPWFLAVNFINPHDICYHGIRDFAETDFERLLVSKGNVECAELDKALRNFDEKSCPPLPENHPPQTDEPSMIEDLLTQRPFRRRERIDWTERDWRRHRWAYHRLTERVDAQIGVLLDALDRSGQTANTVVIFTSDHGDHDASHKLEHKTIFYDEAARVPLLVSDPRCPEAVRGSVNSENLVQTGLDLMATICDYVGAEQPAHNLGMSLVKPARGEAPSSWREGVYAENEISYMYVNDRYKFVRYDSGTNNRQLYDLHRDPGETRNWIGETGMAEIAADLEAAMDREHKRHGELSLADQAPSRAGLRY